MNDLNACVTEALEGVALSSFGNLVLVRGRNVILLNPEKGRNRSKVVIVCGGGSGHEPAHSSFVNHEILSAAICGDVFASPSVGAIVDGVRSLAGKSGDLQKDTGQASTQTGVLVIIKNYTGDKINFGMACEILSSEGLLLRKLIVADDVSLSQVSDRRGVAGTILVYKIAGAFALQQQNGNDNMQRQLDEVYEMAKKVSDNIHSINSLDRECGDGDAGDTFATACNALLSNIRYFSVCNVNVSFRRIAKCLTDAVGGTSGPLYAVFFIRAATAFSSQTDIKDRKEWKSANNWKEAMYKGILGIEELGGCAKGDKTMFAPPAAVRMRS